jgi:hypothetical protein
VLKDAICALGFHRWRLIEVYAVSPALKCNYCRWCSEIRVPQPGTDDGTRPELPEPPRTSPNLPADAGARFEVESAGTKAGLVRPEAIAATRELGIDISVQ